MKPHVDRDAERAAVKERKVQWERYQRRQHLLQGILQRKDGRELLSWLLEITDYLGEAFSTNSLVMAHNTGRQAVGRQILAEFMEASPEGYMIMQNELLAESRKEMEDARRDDSADTDGGTYSDE